MAFKYRVVLADPPWDYGEGFYSINRTLNVNHVTSSGSRWSKPVKKDLPYGSMTLDEIASIPVQSVTHTDGAYCFMWTTSRYLPASFSILEAWGFTYRQTLVWHKVKAVTPFGGCVAPNHAEFVLVGKCGKVKLKGRTKSSVIVAPGMSGRRKNAHSRKPEALQDVIEQVCHGPYLEMFARRQRLGWDVWGNEVESDVDLAA